MNTSTEEKILAELDDIRTILVGKDGTLGIVQKVNVMWRAHVWLLCTISALAGSVLTAALMKWVA